MKRLIFILISSLALLSMCSNQKSDEVLTVVNPFTRYHDELEKYSNYFEESTKIEVEIYTPAPNQTVNELIEELILANNPPDVFPISGYSDFIRYKEIIYSFQNEKWMEQTESEYIVNGVVYGFPIAAQGTGLIANTQYIEALGIDYHTINSFEEMQELVILLNENKEELGFDAVFGLTLDEGADDIRILINILFSGNISDDVEAYTEGYKDALEFSGYPEFVDLIMTYSSKEDLFATTKEIEKNFADGKYVFILAPTTISHELYGYGMNMDYVDIMPPSYNKLSSDRISLAIPYFWSINKYGDVEESLLFLNNLVFTDYGQDYLTTTHLLSPFEDLDYNTYKIEESVIKYYETRHYSIAYMNEIKNNDLNKIYHKIFTDFYYFRDYEAFITDLKNASIGIQKSMGVD